MTRTIKLKTTASGNLALAHPSSDPGSDNLIYAISGVPDGLGAAAVASKLASLILAHPLRGMRGWMYEWAEISGLRAGTIINRY